MASLHGMFGFWRVIISQSGLTIAVFRASVLQSLNALSDVTFVFPPTFSCFSWELLGACFTLRSSNPFDAGRDAWFRTGMVQSNEAWARRPGLYQLLITRQRDAAARWANL